MRDEGHTVYPLVPDPSSLFPRFKSHQNQQLPRRHHLKGAVRRLSTSFFLLLTITATRYAQDLASFEKRISVRKLDNGLTVIVKERPEAPVFSFATIVNVGSA